MMCTTNNRSKQITATVTAVDGGVIMKKFFRHFSFFNSVLELLYRECWH
ncbi:hypothetical protein HMPREF9349_04879 [Escherichia coli MS 79-10]|nr:hypothetical protein HMPREF9349_04879 [Escherichia coli MS 79-10]